MDEHADLVADLRRRLRRWRLATLALSLVVVSLVAIGGTFGLMMMLELQDHQEMLMRLDAAQEQVVEERARADEAAVQAHQARWEEGGKQEP